MTVKQRLQTIQQHIAEACEKQDETHQTFKLWQ